MRNKQLSAIVGDLQAEGLRLGICEFGQTRLDSVRDKKALACLYMQFIDFTFGNDYPSADYIARNFRGVCERFGLHVDEAFRASNLQQVALVGKCDALLSYDGYSVGTVYIRHAGRLAVVASEHAVVAIDCLDTTEVVITASGAAQVIVHRYGSAHVRFETSDTAAVKVVECGNIYPRP